MTGTVKSSSVEALLHKLGNWIVGWLQVSIVKGTYRECKWRIPDAEESSQSYSKGLSYFSFCGSLLQKPSVLPGFPIPGALFHA
jgi:hypothetical protein